MIDRLTRHPYSDARNTAVAALALWGAAVTLAVTSGALSRMGPPLAAALLVFASAIAVAATTMDLRIGAWIASWRPVGRVAHSDFARAFAVLLAIAVPPALALAARALAGGAAGPMAGLLLAGLPPVAGIAAALAFACLRGPGPREGKSRAPVAAPLAAVRASR